MSYSSSSSFSPVLSLDQKTLLLKRLPPFELSYDTILHKKVSGDVFVVIPKGQKAIVWFTYWETRNVCVLMPLNERGEINIHQLRIVPGCYSTRLCYGTIIFGTIILRNKVKHFTCEQLLYYQSHHVQHLAFGEKLNIYAELFQSHLAQKAYTEDFLVLGLPVMKATWAEAQAVSASITQSKFYDVYSIQVYQLHRPAPLGVYKTNKLHNNIGSMSLEAAFLVRPRLQPDLYDLITGDDEFYGLAAVPNYKHSVMMNGLFRRIKENVNLDYLEESDDDDEFENVQEDKFVDLHKSYKMKCVYLKKFRKWQPVICLDNDLPLITSKEAKEMELGI